MCLFLLLLPACTQPCLPSLYWLCIFYSLFCYMLHLLLILCLPPCLYALFSQPSFTPSAVFLCFYHTRHRHIALPCISTFTSPTICLSWLYALSPVLHPALPLCMHGMSHLHPTLPSTHTSLTPRTLLSLPTFFFFLPSYLPASAFCCLSHSLLSHALSLSPLSCHYSTFTPLYQ